MASHAKNKTNIWPQEGFKRQLQGRENAFMNTNMSVINVWSVTITPDVIQKRYPAAGEVLVKIQHTTSAILDKALWNTLEIYAEPKAKYV